MKNTKVRQSNFELMRIISMIFIVLYHIIIHGKILEKATGTCSLILHLIESLIIVHVNSYILLSGYFQSQSKFRLSKVISLNNMTWFYKVLLMFVLIYIGIINRPDLLTFIKTLSPIDYGTYWFINCYIILYLSSPVLNIIINKCSRKFLKNIILIQLLLSTVSTLTVDEFFSINSGRSIITFILLYFIGAYIRKYPPEEWNMFKGYTSNFRTIIYFSLYIWFSVISFLFITVGINMFNYGALSSYCGLVFQSLHVSYGSPIVLLSTIFYFLFFRNLNIKSKLINTISLNTFGVYLISENYFVRATLYDYFKITKIENINIKVIAFSIILSLLVFIICTIIEFIRRHIFNFIYNRKISKLNRERYQNYFKKLGLDINW